MSVFIVACGRSPRWFLHVAQDGEYSENPSVVQNIYCRNHKAFVLPCGSVAAADIHGSTVRYKNVILSNDICY